MSCQHNPVAGGSAGANAGPAVPASASTNTIRAQRLVTHGYQACLRRNYLIQIVNDDLAVLQAQSPTGNLAEFQAARVANWCNHGILPRTIFYQLIKAWKNGLHLTYGINPAFDVSKPSTSNPLAYAVDVGLTFKGFEQLQAHTELTDLFRKNAPAYVQGAPLRAASQLGDSGASASARWARRYQKDQLHAVLVVHAPLCAVGGADAGFFEFEYAVLALLGVSSPAMPWVLLATDWIEKGSVLNSPREVHFGYIDGLSAPRFRGIDTPAKIGAEAFFNVHAAGELLLGHPRNDQSNPWRVPMPPVQQGYAQHIAPLPAHRAYSEFFMDGSFGVLRTMRQDVAAFEDYVAEQANRYWGADNPAYTQARIKAKLLGRWPNGERIEEKLDVTDSRALNPATQQTLIDRTKPIYNAVSTSSNNNFGHHQSDPHGYACPYGAHIRRMNPRDDPVVPILRRPLLRRGTPYGNPYDCTTPDTEERGLLGLFFCTSLEEQFEHLMRNWANNNPMGLPYTRHGKDPIIGNQDGITNAFEIPLRGEPPRLLKELPSFVQTRGTAYVFFPSVTALQKIASGCLISSTKFLKSPCA